MISADPYLVMSIPTAPARDLFALLWESMDLGTQKACAGNDYLRRSGVSSKIIWEAYTTLELGGYIKRPVGTKSWDVVFINPRVIKNDSTIKDTYYAVADGFMPIQYKNRFLCDEGEQ